MRILIQRVLQASVTVEERIVGKIGKGLLVFIGIHTHDTLEDCLWLKEKIVHLRIFPDVEGKMNLSLLDIAGEILIVSQFTLYGDCRKGRRPSFVNSASPELARGLYERFLLEIKRAIPSVQSGIFGAHMQVDLTNDGPLTFLLDSNE